MQKKEKNTLAIDKSEMRQTINLLSYLTKLINRILLKWDSNQIRTVLVKEARVFNQDTGTRNPIFMIKNIPEREIRMQQIIYPCFIS